MSAVIDISGQRFGRLVAISREKSRSSRAMWKCQCDCGNTVSVVGYSLRGGATKSCGCLAVESAVKQGKRNRRHGMTNSPEFRIWTGMISRCTNPKDYRYKRYGARGITVCEEWLTSFEVFLDDVGCKPFPEAELDRKDNDGNYEPGNVRWTSAKVNNNNRSSNRIIEYQGRRQSMTLWAEEIGILPATLRLRLESGWSIERAMTEPVRGTM